MKALVMIFMAMLPLVAPAESSSFDKDGHTLVRQWQAYGKAAASDVPQTQLDILSGIKKDAFKGGLAWDYYDACKKFYDVSVDRNWKLQDSLSAVFDREAKNFPAPVVRFYHRLDRGAGVEELHALIDRKDMEPSVNRGFYINSSFLDLPDMKGYLKNAVADDYEFSLWGLYLRHRDSTARALLEEKVGGVKAGIVELVATPDDSLAAFVRRHAGESVSVIARKRLLWNKFYELNSVLGSSAEYRSLRSECEALERERKSFKGEDAVLLSGLDGIKSLIDCLDKKALSAELKDGRMSVLFRNSSSARVTICAESGKKKAFDKVVANPAGSYYVQDTVSFDLPLFDDGQYNVTVRDGDCVFEMPYQKMTVSFAVRSTAGSSMAAFAADYSSGRPIGACSLVLEKGGKVVKRVDDFRFNGFTVLPASIISAASGGRSSLYCEFVDANGIARRSEPVFLYVRNRSAAVARPSRRAVLLTDCTAFHRGDTVHFKTVLFDDDGNGTCVVAAKGEKLTAVLRDTEGKTVGTTDLETGEFGSAAGSFGFDSSGRNGSYLLEIRCGKSILATKSLRVDDFILPSYEIVFDAENGRSYFCGDTVTIEGRINSYSGHSLSSSTVTATVDDGSDDVQSTFRLSQDGRFVIEFPTDPSEDWVEYYSATVKIVDATGETVEQGRDIFLLNKISLSAEVVNEIPGRMELPRNILHRCDCHIVEGRQARVKVKTGSHPDLKLSYKLFGGDEKLAAGEASPEEVLDLELGGNSALYRLEICAEVARPGMKAITDSMAVHIFKCATDGATVVPEGIENVFVPVENGYAEVKFGSGEAPVWVLADLTDEDGRLLASDMVPLAKGEFHGLRYSLKNTYGRTVTLQMMYFRDGHQYSWSHSYANRSEAVALPLEFVTFKDLTSPGSRNVFRIRSLSGVECAAAVFDKSLEEIAPNRWDSVSAREKEALAADYSIVCGNDLMDPSPVLYRASNGMLTKSAGLSVAEYDYAGEVYVGGMPEEEVYVRKDFSTAVAFEPFLRSDKDGFMDLEFTNSDKLSTFVIQLFAHDRRMANKVLRREMLVSIPVKLSLAEPQFLYEGDRYVARVSLSSNQDKPVSGQFRARIFNGADMDGREPLCCHTESVCVVGRSSESISVPVEVPQCGELGIFLQFTPDGSGTGDAMFVTVPVRKKDQVLTEAHSEVLLSGADRDAAIERLKAAFVNTDAADAGLKEISVLDMVKAAVPQTVTTSSRDLVSLSGALVASVLARSLGTQLESGVEGFEKDLLKCRNADGGFSWFEGMESSPFLTAVLLQRLYGLKSRGLQDAVPQVFAAVPQAAAYLDSYYFADRELPYWRGGIPMEQYLLVRSMYSDCPLSDTGVSAKDMRKFRKEAKRYLLPSAARGLNGEILPKARRLMTLSLLSEAPAGGFDIGVGGKRALLKSWKSDMASLKQYAVEHSGGGMYFPNAVMPFRGLMEDELAAHSLICDLFHRSGDAEAESIADGVRIWLMLQKETQQWGDNPAFVEALASVMDGTPAALGTKVISMIKSYTVPEVGAVDSGNGFTLERKFLRDGKALAEGDTLHIGDRVEAVYAIWNGENRSFVRLTAPRPACMRPVEQLSGLCGFAYYGGYRDVRDDRTEYWYESFPEEKTNIEESLFVTQEGVFHLPVAEIECLYAPHYRANSSSAAPFVAEGTL